MARSTYLDLHLLGLDHGCGRLTNVQIIDRTLSIFDENCSHFLCEMMVR